MSKRVHQLAEELGVKSTAIVSKCQAEGLDIKNHMSTLSAGLEATIREWFSAEATVTAVETAAPVDLEEVRAKKPRSRKKKAEPAEAEAAVVGEAEVVKSPVAGEVESEAPAAEQAPVVEGEAIKPSKIMKPRRRSPKELATAEAPVLPEVIAVKPPEAQAEGGKETEQAEEVVEIKPEPLRMLPQRPPAPKPKPIKHVPKPATMKGPKIVRMERPDTVSATGPRETRRRGGIAIGIKHLAPLGPEMPSRGGLTTRKSRKRGLTVDEEQILERETIKRAKSRKRRSGRGYETTDFTGPHEWGNLDLLEREQRLAQASGGKLLGRARRLALEEESSSQTQVIKPRRIEKAAIKEPITVKELSAEIGVRVGEIISRLMEMEVMAGINDVIERDAAVMVAMEFGVELTVDKKVLQLDRLRQEFDEQERQGQLGPRPPVVAFLGHVDHGKTSLLDRIRRTKVTAGEAGGITQHIGSYLYDDGKRRVAFLDTPGHKAFTAMRARGANMTDIVVLVVAADDGVMPQTEEAINHARAAHVPIVVALNKIDLPNADVNRALGQLSEKGLIPAEWGGDTEVVRTSAMTGEGIEDLIEHLDYVAELQHLRAKYEGPATGWVVESEMTLGQGALARLLVKSGSLKSGDVIVSGSSHGRVRTIIDALQQAVKEAGPAMPVEVTGLDEVPVAGNRFFVVEDMARAAQIADEQRANQREAHLSQRRRVTLENLYREIAAGQVRELNVIIKADVQGSVDVLRQAITEMNTSEVAMRILHAAVGGISESDVLLAEASNAIIIGFQVVADEHARALAESRKVEIRLYRVIYDISEDIRKALEGMLSPQIEEKQLGRAAVRKIFKISRFGSIAGCYVTEGVIQRSAKVRLIRDNVVTRDEMNIDSLRREKNDISESRAGFECGIKLSGYDNVKEGDIIEAYEMIEVSRVLEPDQKQTV